MRWLLVLLVLAGCADMECQDRYQHCMIAKCSIKCMNGTVDPGALASQCPFTEAECAVRWEQQQACADCRIRCTVEAIDGRS